MNNDEKWGLYWLIGILAVIFLLYGAFTMGLQVGMLEGAQPAPRGIEHHSKHTQMKAIMRGIKLVTCRECGIVYAPAEAGVAMSEELWEQLWRWTDK